MKKLSIVAAFISLFAFSAYAADPVAIQAPADQSTSAPAAAPADAGTTTAPAATPAKHKKHTKHSGKKKHKHKKAASTTPAQ